MEANAEIKRQAIHLAGATVFALLAYFAGSIITALAAIAVFALALVGSLLIRHGTRIPLVSDAVREAGRKEEKKLPGLGALLFFAGIMVSSILFLQNNLVLVGALLVLGFGDSFSTIVGKLWGKHKTIGKRTLEGSLGGIAAAFIALCFLLNPQTAFIAAFLGMLAEYLPINDNFSIPIVAGIVLTLLI